ncbi:LPS-assembly lipoprotein LptE [Roseateles sp. DB2]|uniref:LPS-assembly lipoprotein LptE n=1 Tax=Roseateles sp. DB2 TaxID=3453717 RepID=UPI003EEDFC17
MSHLSRRGLLALPLLSGLAACGFELRRDPEFAFQSLALTGFAPDSPLAEELRRQLRQSPLQLVQDPSKAQVVLEALRDSRERSVVVSTSAGQVREWQLKLQLDYLVRTPGGEPLLPNTELRMSREMSYLESQALAKEQEEAALYRAMQYDAAAQVMRRLGSVRLR